MHKSPYINDMIDLSNECECEHRDPVGCSILKNNSVPSDPSLPIPSLSEAPLWLQDYEARQIGRDATMSTKLDRMEAALVLLSSQLVHNNQSDKSDTDNEASEMASGPSAQSLIECGVTAGWKEFMQAAAKVTESATKM